MIVTSKEKKRKKTKIYVLGVGSQLVMKEEKREREKKYSFHEG